MPFRFAVNLLEHVIKEDLNLWECVAFSGDLECAKIYYEELSKLFKSTYSITDMDESDQIWFARLLQERLRNALHYGCALAHSDVFDFLLAKCFPAGENAGYLVKSLVVHSPHKERFRRRFPYHVIWIDTMIFFKIN